MTMTWQFNDTNASSTKKCFKVSSFSSLYLKGFKNHCSLSGWLFKEVIWARGGWTSLMQSRLSRLPRFLELSRLRSEMMIRKHSKYPSSNKLSQRVKVWAKTTFMICFTDIVSRSHLTRGEWSVSSTVQSILRSWQVSEVATLHQPPASSWPPGHQHSLSWLWHRLHRGHQCDEDNLQHRHVDSVDQVQR